MAKELEQTNGSTAQEPLLQVRDLKKYFPVRGGLFRTVQGYVRAVDGVSFDVKEGETFGLVGESGCGKTTLGRSILRLTEPTSGKVFFEGQEITGMPTSRLKPLRRDLQIIFQDPYSSLDPRMPIGQSIAEALAIHNIGTPQTRHEMVQEALERVGLFAQHARRFPHEFSGGQRQRIGIARALVLRPKFIMCDEPVSALDVSIQSQVLNLLRELQDEFGLTYIFVAHNLSVVEHISDRVAVMYLGKIAEISSRKDLYANPTHPYTRALLSAIPIPNPKIKRERIILQGDVPSPVNPPSGCRFHPRCPIAVEGVCDVYEPELLPVEGQPDHLAACHLRTGEYQNLDPVS